MVVLTNPKLDQLSLVKPQPNDNSTVVIPVIDLCNSPSEAEAMVKACEEFGIFKAINHGVSMELIARLENEAVKFFSLPSVEKERFGPANPFGYGNKNIGMNGDIGWVEYLLFMITSKPLSDTSLMFLNEPSATSFRLALDEYLAAVRKMANEVLELIAEGLKIEPRNALSKLVMSEESDKIFRINHYPPCQWLQELNCGLIGFGEHTDPQIISVLRSNSCSGLEICLKDGSWVAVPSDPESFYINVGDTLQVLTNGRLGSVRHRVLANGVMPRLSMIYFFGTTLSQKIAPLPQLIAEGQQSLYKEFTWSEYKQAAYKTRLSGHRLGIFEKHL